MCVYAAITVNDKQMLTLKSLIKISINTHRTKAKMAKGQGSSKGGGGGCGERRAPGEFQQTWLLKKYPRNRYFKYFIKMVKIIILKSLENNISNILMVIFNDI